MKISSDLHRSHGVSNRRLGGQVALPPPPWRRRRLWYLPMNWFLIMLCLYLSFAFSDYVFFETSSTSPYQIRRIEELNKVRAFYSAFQNKKTVCCICVHHILVYHDYYFGISCVPQFMLLLVKCVVC